MINELILPFSLILPGLWILQITKVKVDGTIERLSFSYILSLTVMFSLLYTGAILYCFNIASFVYLIILIASFIYLSASFIYKTLQKGFYKISIFKFSLEKLILVISTAGLLSIYMIFLHVKAILDSDVVHYYLPIAREVVRANGFTYSTGYDYNILLKPIGVSVLYAWVYVVNGSILSEAFRLMPLLPLFMMIILNYAIVTLATKSQKIGLLSTALFLVLPFHDRFLLYNSFYPDVFYYPIIFSVVYFFIKYSYSKRSILLFWMGTSLGCAALFKAQTIYFFITSVLIFLILELRVFKKFSMALCAVGPFLISIPDILASSIQREGIRLSIPNFTETQLGLLFFLSIFCAVCYLVTAFRNVRRTKIGKPLFKEIIKKIFLLVLPFVLLSSFWYIHNFLRFGTLLYTSSLNLPNYDWALKILQSLKTAQPPVSIWHYVMYFVFMFIDPAVMGYIMLVPLSIGLLLILKKAPESFTTIFLFEIITSALIFSAVITTQSETYNPRDILPLAPLLTSLAAIGIEFAISTGHKKNRDAKGMFASFLLIIYFGFLAYIHSVYVYYISLYNKITIVDLMSILGKIANLNLIQTSFQLSYNERALFVAENFQKIFSLSMFAGIPLFILMVYRYLISFYTNFPINHHHIVNIKFVIASKKIMLKLPLSFFSRLMETILVFFLMLSIILIPRIEILIAQGGLQGLRENQLKNNYGSLYGLFASTIECEGGILTIEAPMGLPYYMPNSKIVDLNCPANLAFLKDCLSSNDSYKIVAKLKQLGINYILINPSSTRTKNLDVSLNFSISSVTRNPELALLSKSFGSWKLYTLGPYNVEKIKLPLFNWSVDSQYTNASYIFDSNEYGLFLGLNPTDSNSKVRIFTRSVPKLNLSDYDYIIVKLEGSNNARILLRFLLTDGSSLDVVYWRDPYTLVATPFDLRTFSGKMLRGEVYIELISSDGLPSSFNLFEISFVKIKR
jgi:hypothetical protein